MEFKLTVTPEDAARYSGPHPVEKAVKRSIEEALPSALAKAVKAFPHLASLPERDLARNACRLVIPGLSGLELLALTKAAWPLKGAK